jgi:hypothetical protein
MHSKIISKRGLRENILFFDKHVKKPLGNTFIHPQPFPGWMMTIVSFDLLVTPEPITHKSEIFLETIAVLADHR